MAERPSPHRLRALKLLVGGAIGGGAAAVACALAYWLADGAAAALSALVIGAIVIAFFALGQAVQVLVADALPVNVMAMSLISYAVRVVGVTALLAAVRVSNWTDPKLVAVTTVAVVLGWVTGEIRAFVKLRIPVFDSTDKAE